METANDIVKNRSLHISKLLNAPVELVWKVWTNPEHIANWWGPYGFTNSIHKMDLVPDGEWSFIMHGPDDKNYPNKSIFIEIVPKQKIVFQHFNPDFITTIVFESEENATLLKWTMLFETSELFDTIVKVFKADEGLNQNVEKLENYLEQIIQ